MTAPAVVIYNNNDIGNATVDNEIRKYQSWKERYENDINDNNYDKDDYNSSLSSCNFRLKIKRMQIHKHRNR